MIELSEELQVCAHASRSFAVIYDDAGLLALSNKLTELANLYSKKTCDRLCVKEQQLPDLLKSGA